MNVIELEVRSDLIALKRHIKFERTENDASYEKLGQDLVDDRKSKTCRLRDHGICSSMAILRD